jgi:hypothetical protein
MGISLKQKIPSQADWPETTTHPVGTDVWISATLEGTSETRTGEPEKENGEKSNGNLETTKTKTNSAVNEGRSKNATLTEEDETLTEEQGVHVLGSFFMPERSNMRYPEYGNMTAAEKVASEYVTREIHVTDYTYDPLATCSVTSQVRIIQKSSQWIMQSIDTNGNNKTVGGDEFYVTYTDNNPPHKGNHTAVALIKDLQNGLYQLTFKTTPTDPHPGNLTGVGTLSVRFLYSCNIGLAPRPVKDNWKAGGATLLIHHTKSNVTQPPIRTFRPPSGVGLSTFDLVVSFGDSMMETFVRSKTGNKAYHRRKTVWSNNPKSDLYSGSRSRLLEKLESWHGKQHLNRTNVALLLGSSAWDILRPSKPLPDFSDHIDTCRRFVRKVQDRYPNVTVIWKAPAAIVSTVQIISYLFLVKMSWSIKLVYANQSVFLHSTWSTGNLQLARQIYAAFGAMPLIPV